MFYKENNFSVYMHISPSNKVYIGITSQVPASKRWGKHGEGYRGNKHFYSAISKYGWENFMHIIIYTNLSKQDACKKEIELIAIYESTDSNFGYNHSTGGEYNNGYKWTAEQRKKLSIAIRKRLEDQSVHERMSAAKKKELWNY